VSFATVVAFKFDATRDVLGDEPATLREAYRNGVFPWPAFRHTTGNRRSGDKYIVLDVPIREDHRLREDQCNFWEPFFLQTVVGSVPAAQASPGAGAFCGAAIFSDLKLDRDLACTGSGNALTVAADGIRIIMIAIGGGIIARPSF